MRTRRVTMREEWDLQQRQAMIAQAKAEAEREQAEDAEAEREAAEEAAYQEYLLLTKQKLGLITDEELDAMKQALKKK